MYSPFTELDSRVIIKDILRDSENRKPIWWQRIVLKLTYPIWQPMVIRILDRLYMHRVIDSSRLHIMTALFDRTQDWGRW